LNFSSTVPNEDFISVLNCVGATSIFSHRFEYSLPPSSCDGDPAPNLALPGALAIPLTLGGFPKGDLIELFVGVSIGDVFAVEDADFD